MAKIFLSIIVTILGVSIGVKYSIDHNLLSPLTRIIVGYIVSLGLLGFGIKLKAKYNSYSAVLAGGAIASCFNLGCK